MTELDLLLTGGTVVSEGAARPAQVGVAGGRIAVVAEPGIDLPAAERIDLSGKIVIPGAIDCHLHARTYDNFCDDFPTAAASAAHGGITTVMLFTLGTPDVPVRTFLQRFIDEGNQALVTDFALHAVLLPAHVDQVPQAFDLGVPSFKLLMAYGKIGWLMSDYDLLEVMRQVGERRGLAMVHAENGGMCDFLEDAFVRAGQLTADRYGPSRPNVTEAEAISRAIDLSRLAECPLYVVHLSTHEGHDEIVRRRHAGDTVYTETCPHYLLLTDEAMPDLGPLGKVAPPLRSAEDTRRMWRGLQDGSIEILSSDHAPHHLANKIEPRAGGIFGSPLGMPGTETLLPLAYSEGVAKGRISLERLVELLCENPARRFGLYPRKGTIRVGSDADLTVIDPTVQWTIAAADLHSASGYTPYEGWPVTGKPVLTLLRGRVLLRDGRLEAPAGYGQFLPRGELY